MKKNNTAMIASLLLASAMGGMGYGYGYARQRKRVVQVPDVPRNDAAHIEVAAMKRMRKQKLKQQNKTK